MKHAIWLALVLVIATGCTTTVPATPLPQPTPQVVTVPGPTVTKYVLPQACISYLADLESFASAENDVIGAYLNNPGGVVTDRDPKVQAYLKTDFDRMTAERKDCQNSLTSGQTQGIGA